MPVIAVITLMHDHEGDLPVGPGSGGQVEVRAKKLYRLVPVDMTVKEEIQPVMVVKARARVPPPSRRSGTSGCGNHMNVDRPFRR